jgi:spectinomycin phosphotransferase/16S rRNA (guanine(1405)-N(7))-methyltransferase
VLSPPEDLSQEMLASALARAWPVSAASMTYRPVGWGSHHWEVTDTAGTRWFVTVDELEHKQLSLAEPLATTFGRLRAALAAAGDLRDCGRAFVVAPVPGTDGEPLARLGGRFAVALYPFVDGQSFEWGDFPSPAHRRGVLDMLIAIHTAPAAARRRAAADDFAVPHRDEMEAALGSAGEVADSGPYARPAALLLAQNAAGVRRLLDRYDQLAAQSRSWPSRAVLTHGEPHPGNTMLTSAGWLLIDWDTALVAPPERDLWSLDPGDGSALAAYADATGVTPLAAMLELYRIRWDLADIAVDVSRFRRPHPGSADDDQSWQLLRSLVTRVSS